jgi:STI1 domain
MSWSKVIRRHPSLCPSPKVRVKQYSIFLSLLIMMSMTIFTRVHHSRFIPQLLSSFTKYSVEAFPIVASPSRRNTAPLPFSLVGLQQQQQQQRTKHSLSSWFGLKSTATTSDPITDAATGTTINKEDTTAATDANHHNHHNNSPNTLPPISTMTGREMKLELESYGINTKSFFEKSEYRAALEKARADGLQPISTTTTTSTTTTSTDSTKSSSSSSTSSSSSSSSASREERIQTEMVQCQTMKARDMKQELEDVYGISTRSLLEKSELVRALAEARVDGVTTTKSKNNNNNSNNNSNSNEGYAEYKDVEVLTDDSSGPRQRGQEAKTPPQAQEVQQPMNPFAGMGGMGGMGGFANLFKTMGGVGNASPFGSGGGNPFGNVGSNDNMMRKVQEMMSNPKVMAIMQKAQGNPRIMAKVQECMTNPTAMLKYQNDPEVAELIRELQPYLK